MKLLAVFLLVGLAFASAVPLFDDDLETELDQIADELGDEFIVYTEGGFVARLKQRFEDLLERIKKGADEGKGVDRDLFKKAEDFYDRLKGLGVQVSDKLKQIFEDLRSRLGGNSLQHADWKDWKDRLRQLRDRIQDHEFDEEKIRTFIENLFGKSEMTNQFLEMLKTKGEKGKQRIIDFINRILGEKQEAFAPQHADFREHLRQLRDRIQNHKFDAERIRALVEKLFGKSEMTDQFLEKLRTVGEKGKQKLIDFINRILGDKQEASAPQRGDFRELFKQLRDKIQQNYEFEEPEILALLQDTFGMNEITNKAREMLDREDGKQRLLDLLNRIVGDKQEAIPPQSGDFRELLTQLRDKIQQNHAFKEAEILALLLNTFGVNEITIQVREMIKREGGKERLLEFCNRILGDKQEAFPVEHSIKEIYEKVKNFFRDLNIELKDRFVKFGEYVKEQYHKGLDKTKSDIDNIKNIAHEFVEDSRKISKDLAEEALEFFRQYKDDLGHIYEDVVDKVRDILNKDH